MLTSIQSFYGFMVTILHTNLHIYVYKNLYAYFYMLTYFYTIFYIYNVYTILYILKFLLSQNLKCLLIQTYLCTFE